MPTLRNHDLQGFVSDHTFTLVNLVGGANLIYGAALLFADYWMGALNFLAGVVVYLIFAGGGED